MPVALVPRPAHTRYPPSGCDALAPPPAMDPTETGHRRLLRLTQGVAFAFLIAFTLHALFWRGDGLDGFFNDWVYNGLVVASAVLCLTRAVRRRSDRLAWALIGVALSMWASAELLNTFYLSHLSNPPYPSIADGLWLGFYPPAYVALVL